jgi:AbrB family looped-hinge helix DNA binding protein
MLTICHRDVSVGELLMKTTIGQGGRLVIPSPYRKALGLRDGDDVVVSLKGDELRIQTTRQAIRRAQQLVRRYVPRDRSLVAELIAERRRNARRE